MCYIEVHNTVLDKKLFDKLDMFGVGMVSCGIF